MLGGHAVAECLRNEGVRHVFCVPGESHIAVLDGLCGMPEIKLITNRQEGGACFMAEGYAKATRKPVEREPGGARSRQRRSGPGSGRRLPLEPADNGRLFTAAIGPGLDPDRRR
jgi:hypothetical protein